jgi:hypothetical protein
MMESGKSEAIGSVNCPYCGQRMVRVFAALSGGVWLCESRETMAWHVGVHKGEIPVPEGTVTVHPHPPIHCVIGNSGYKVGSWPKEGLFCHGCNTFVIRGGA